VSIPAPHGRLSAEQYLSWEEANVERHEFFQGEVFAMAGGSPRHNAITAALTGELVLALRDGPCRVLSADQRIAARGNEHYVYADASVLCGALELQPNTTDVLTNPRVIIEVLSKRTEPYDRGLKWESYRTLPSVTDYLLVSQTTPRIEHYQRQPSGEWLYRVVEAGESVRLSIGAALSIDAVFAGVLELSGE
jgi:Uma2 family endonuclease